MRICFKYNIQDRFVALICPIGVFGNSANSYCSRDSRASEDTGFSKITTINVGVQDES
jgi:hypothetical protein